MTQVVRDEDATLFKTSDFTYIIRKIQEAEEGAQTEVSKDPVSCC